MGQGEQAVGGHQVRVAFHEAVGRVDPTAVGVLPPRQGGHQVGPPVVAPALVVGPDVEGLIPSPLTAEEFNTVSVGGQ